MVCLSFSAFSCTVPQRVVTGTVGLDELTLRLLKAASREGALVGVSYLADDPRYSVSPQSFKSVPFRVGSDLESLFITKPDLAILSSYNRVQFIKQVHAARIPLIQTDSVLNMKDLKKLIRQLGNRLCLSGQADTFWKEVETQVVRLKNQVKSKYPKRLSILLLQPNLVIQAKNTLANDLFREIGFVDAANSLNISGWAKVQSESLAVINPDVVVTSGYLPEAKKMRTLLLGSVYAKKWPALKKDRVFAVSPALFSSSSHDVLKFAQQVLASLEV